MRGTGTEATLQRVSEQARQVLAEALRLPIDERADVVVELLRSLDAAERALPPDEVQRLWTDELTRRAERAIHGGSAGGDASEVLKAIEAKLRR
ncbi:MAG: addiction module protein [Polyangiaceae bacterium]